MKNTSPLAKIIIALGAATGIGVASYGVYGYLQGQTCSANPGSPCYVYTQAYQTCLNQYTTANQQFLLEDQAAGRRKHLHLFQMRSWKD